MSIRNSSPSLEHYLEEIRHIPLMSREDEAQKATLCQAGDHVAEEQLLKANLRFVVSVARTYSWSDVPLEGLINTGNHGLLEAVRNYKPDRGARLISYAVWYIRRNIREELAKFQHIIKSTTSRQTELLAIRRSLETASIGQEGKPLTPEQLHDLGISDAQLIAAKAASTHQSLDANFEGSEGSLHDLLEDESGIAPDAFVDAEHHAKTIERLIETLTEEEAKIIRFMSGLEDGRCHTASEASARLNLSTQVVNARHSVAMRKMRITAKAMLKEKGETFFDD